MKVIDDIEWRVAQRRLGTDLKVELIKANLSQREVAEAMEPPITDSAMSDFLLARRRAPEDFEQRIRSAVARLRGAA